MKDHIMSSSVRCIVIACAITLCASGRSFAQGGGYGTTFAADLAFPMGVFANSFKTGFGGHVDFYFESEKYLRLDVLLGYTRWGVDQDKINEQYTAEGGKGTLQLEGHVNAFPIMVGVHLLSPEGGMRFYGLVEAGLYIYSGEVTGQKIENGVTTQNIYEQKSSSTPAATLGAGFLFPVGKDVALDLCGRYHFIKRETYYTYSTSGNQEAVSTDKYFSLAIGVTYSFSVPGGQ